MRNRRPADPDHRADAAAVDRSRRDALRLSAGLLLPAFASARAADAPPADSARWNDLKGGLFGGRPIAKGDGSVLTLQMPERAADAGIVPLSVWPADTPQGRAVRKLHLVIDENPSPVIGTFVFGGDAPAGLETRVRVESYTYARAIAEDAHGALHESVRYVKASGGCSAPAGKDAAAAAAAVGRMRLRVPDELVVGQPVNVQLMVQHPNHSGLAMDQVTRLFEPAWFVNHVEVAFDGQPVWQADVNFSLSENPNFRFRFVPRGAGTLTAAVRDTRGARYEVATAVRPAASRSG